jgi:hypothetical protein
MTVLGSLNENSSMTPYHICLMIIFGVVHMKNISGIYEQNLSQKANHLEAQKQYLDFIPVLGGGSIVT